MKKGPPKRASLEKRAAIVRQAFAVFYKHGFHASGVDSLLRGTGISKRTLYKHFESKEALITATIDYYYQNNLKSISGFVQGGNAQSAVARVLMVFDWLEMMIRSGYTSGCFAINAKMEYSDREAGIERSCDQYFASVEQLIADLCKQARCKDAKKVARQLTLLFEGATVNFQITREARSIQAAKEAAKVLLLNATP